MSDVDEPLPRNLGPLDDPKVVRQRTCRDTTETTAPDWLLSPAQHAVPVFCLWLVPERRSKHLLRCLVVPWRASPLRRQHITDSPFSVELLLIQRITTQEFIPKKRQVPPCSNKKLPHSLLDTPDTNELLCIYERLVLAIDALNAQDAAAKLSAMRDLFRLTMERRPRRSEGGMTRLQRFLLSTIARQGPLTMSDLTRILEVGPTTASQFISHLESRGLVLRSFDPDDRRRHLVSITDAGQAVADQTRQSRHQRLERMLDRLTDVERIQLVHLAERLTDILAHEPELLKEDLPS